jgi:Fic family protein
MEALIIWTDDRLREQDLHPLLIVSTFVYEFLSIHPYQDGNGRLSRLLTTLLLMKLGYGFIQYVSFEHVVESKKEAYYRALMDGQKNRYNEQERIDRWILFFLESLMELTKRLETKYDTYSRLKVVLNERQQLIVAYVQKKETAQISQIETGMENYSRNTIKKDLAYLVGEGILLKTGAGRAVRYHIKK